MRMLQLFHTPTTALDRLLPPPRSRPSSAASDTLKSQTFHIYPADESETDRLVTKVLVVGDFERAVVSPVYLLSNFADVILLPKGGPELGRAQKAYFERRTVALQAALPALPIRGNERPCRHRTERTARLARDLCCFMHIRSRGRIWWASGTARRTTGIPSKPWSLRTCYRGVRIEEERYFRISRRWSSRAFS